MKKEIKETSEILNKTYDSLTKNSVSHFIRCFRSRKADNMKDTLCLYTKESIQNDIAIDKAEEPVTSWVEYYSKRFDR